MKKFLKTIDNVTEFIVGKKSAYTKSKPKKKRTYKRKKTK